MSRRVFSFPTALRQASPTNFLRAANLWEVSHKNYLYAAALRQASYNFFLLVAKLREAIHKVFSFAAELREANSRCEFCCRRTAGSLFVNKLAVFGFGA